MTENSTPSPTTDKKPLPCHAGTIPSHAGGSSAQPLSYAHTNTPSTHPVNKSSQKQRMVRGDTAHTTLISPLPFRTPLPPASDPSHMAQGVGGYCTPSLLRNVVLNKPHGTLYWTTEIGDILQTHSLGPSRSHWHRLPG